MNTMLHIVPQLPPAMDGVGDYCANLWRHWPDRETRWHFAVLHGAASTQAVWPDLPIHSFGPSAAQLAGVLGRSGADTVVLHYVGYGYHPRGIPVWLPSALERWRHESGGHLITMFHEIYAEGSPWRSAFWVKPWARRIIARLVAASDAWVTNCECYFDWLMTEFQAEPERGHKLVIGSNVPAAADLEFDRLWPFEFGRKLRVAVFGFPNTRQWALNRHANFLAALVQADMVEAILLVGRSSASDAHRRTIDKFQRHIGGEWRAALDLPTAQVADAIAGCDIGLVTNGAGTLSKSGVFAALAINGVVPIVAHDSAFSVAPPFNDCVLVNDDQPVNAPALLAELRGNNRMRARRRHTFRAAQSELAWSSIAQSWRDLICQSIPPSAVREDPAGGLALDENPSRNRPLTHGGVRA